MAQDKKDEITRLTSTAFRLLSCTLLCLILTTVNVSAQVTIRGNVYGGGNEANVGGSVTVNMTGGTVEKDVYGGGALANTNTGNTSNTTDNTTSVNLTGGTIQGDAYGGGLGDATHAALVQGDVTVTLNGTKMVTGYTTGDDPVVNAGRVFGCNNVKGTPKGHVKVLVTKTTEVTGLDTNQPIDVAAVFGGGNLADYEPTNTNDYAEVEINKASGEGSRLVAGYVFGGGNQAGVTGGTLVNILDGEVRNGVYGGCDTRGTVTKDVTVNVTGGTIGTPWTTPVPSPYPQMVFGGGLGQNTLVSGSVTVNIGGQDTSGEDPVYSGSAVIWGDVYGGSAKGNVNATSTNDVLALTTGDGIKTDVNLYGGTIKGDLYGGGLGQKNGVGGATSDIAANVYGPVTVTTKGGEAHNVFGCNNSYGAPQLTASVNIGGGTFTNVYGGGNVAAYQDNGTAGVAVTMTDGTTYNLFGGGLGTTAVVNGSTSVRISGGTVNHNLYGGGSQANVTKNVSITISGGTVTDDVYGGGALACTNTANWDWTIANSGEVGFVEVTGLTVGTTAVAGYYRESGVESSLITQDLKAQQGETYYKKIVIGGWATNMNNESTGTTYKTTVTLTGGVVGNVYGGGLGELGSGTSGQVGYVAPVAANVYGDVEVTINDPAQVTATSGDLVAFTKVPSEVFTIGESTTEHTVDATGHVFGCNNINGTPTGNVTVHVFKTKYIDQAGGIHTDYHVPNDDDAETADTYEIQGVYGGGNLAGYMPANGKKTSVIIEGCGDTSIKKVYGGGNSAPVPETDVLIKSTYSIGYAFGGGNGGEYIKKNGVWQNNEGAIVIGTAKIACKGGKVGSVFGGSDSKGSCGGVNLDQSEDLQYKCPLIITRLYGAGNEADVIGNVNMILAACTSNEIEYVHGGSYNANVSGDVTLTITSGILKNVYGGNDSQGSIGGKITVNIEESDCDKPIIIQNLVGGGNNADYPGINRSGVDLAQDPNWKGKITVNVKSATRIDNVFGGCFNAEANGDTEVNINMIKGKMAGATNVSIPKRYYDSEKGVLIPNITYKGTDGNKNILCDIAETIGSIGNVYGGGNEGRVNGSSTVNIGASETIETIHRKNGHIVIIEEGVEKEITEESSGRNLGNITIKMDENVPAEGANITGSVYGGGKLADVGHYTFDDDGQIKVTTSGNASVNICAKNVLDANNEPTNEYVPVAPNNFTVTIGGNVFGGGQGEATTFECDKAMVLGNVLAPNSDTHTGGTYVRIGNGTVKGSVYGGGEIGRLEANTEVTIGLASGTTAPVIEGDVFGAGKGVETHGYAALVRGNSTVTIQGNAEVRGSVYGGGEIASVGRYKVASVDNLNDEEWVAANPGIDVGMPYSLANEASGNCYVTVKGYAKIGPTTAMKMPDFTGNVFGAGKGAVPGTYSYTDKSSMPKRMITAAMRNAGVVVWDNADDEGKYIWDYLNTEARHLSFLETLALTTQTVVTISDNAFIKGSVYGGSENGYVQHDTYVTIEDDCQIGCGKNESGPYTSWPDPLNTTITTGFNECDSWPYESPHKPYDPNALSTGKYENGDESYGMPTGSDGHTFYGNVFGGGSGYFPYKDINGKSKWHRQAGSVGGNTKVQIDGGHILTNVYGGNEMTNVGTYDATGKVVSGGKCTVEMTDGTIGVPRTLQQINDHPVTCYLYGAGKGDQRVFFNKDTNVKDVEVKVTGGIIYGSVFGGGEDGHVLRDVTMTIGDDEGNGPTIGTWGTSYVDGNVFGGGRGFGGEAYTAGNVAGSVALNIKGGTMLGSIYGGGRLGSVGYGLYDATTNNQPTPGYGEMRNDDKYDDGTDGSAFFTNGRGHVTIDISGGTIGNNHEFRYLPNNADMSKIGDTDKTYDSERGYYLLNHTKGGNVFAGGMGRRTDLNGDPIIYNQNDPNSIEWRKLGNVKSTKLTISGTPWIKGNVYGGGEFGAVQGNHTTKNAKNEDINVGTEIIITGGTIGTVMGDNITASLDPDNSAEVGTGDTRYSFGSIYGGGYGTEAEATIYETDVEKFGAWISDSTYINISGTTKVRGSVYGGGEMACVKGNTNVNVSNGEIGVGDVRVTEGDKQGYVLFGSWRMGNVYGAGKGSANAVSSGLVQGNTSVTISGGNIYHNVYGGGAYGSVGTYTLYTDDNIPAYLKANVPVGTPSGCAPGTGTATVTITSGQIGINGWDNGMVSGSGRGDVSKPGNDNFDIYDRMAWVDSTSVTIGVQNDATAGPIIKGSLYGGGENGHNLHNSEVHIYSGTIGHNASASYDNGNVYGSGCGTDKYTDNDNNKHHNPLAGLVQGSARVNIHGGHVLNSVFGGGSMAAVGVNGTKATVNVSGGSIDGSVYGGPRGDLDDHELKAYANATEVSISGGSITGSVYGGGMAGIVKDNVKVYMTGGTIANDLYGGGALADVNTSNWNTTTNSWAEGKYNSTTGKTTHNTTVTLTGGRINGDAYGGGLGRKEVRDGNTVTTAGIEATVYGDIAVTLGTLATTENPTTTATAFNINYLNSGTQESPVPVVNSGRVFGCNNLNGSPKGNVTVTINKTVAGNTSRTTPDPTNISLPQTGEGVTPTYEVAAVYGGGNLADYTATGKKPSVIINSCDVSIEEVYGGGNAAAVPQTDVLVLGAYEIGNVFGGGNGEDKYTLDGGSTWVTNPGADVNGNATTLLKGGYIHAAYGGSNSKGTISGNVSINKASGGICPLHVVEIYGAGKDADIEGDLILVMGCSETRTDAVYGCSMNANVKGNVELTITSGEYGKVFGGNNQSGAIFGHIVVNIEETGCTPIVIDELYGCGNDAAYSVYGYYHAKKYVKQVSGEEDKWFLDAGKTIPLYKDNSGNLYQDEGKTKRLYIDTNDFLYINEEKTRPLYMPRTSATDENTAVTFTGKDHTIPTYADPQVNIISCTRIGKVFGGGYGANATVYGNPKVNINQIYGTPNNVTASTLGRIGVDGNNSSNDCGVFGGGNEAKVVGNTTVNIGTVSNVQLHLSADDNGVYTMSGNNTVLGANIVGTVYGGGNLADVTGNTFVNVCAIASDDTYTAVAEGSEKVNIGGNVFGGGKGIDDSFFCEKGMVGEDGKGVNADYTDNDDYHDGNTHVTIGNGTIGGNVYGGGEIGRVEKNTTVTIGLGEANATTPTSAPNIRGDVFGGGKGKKTHGYAALVRGNPTVIVQADAKVGHSVYGAGEIASVARYRVPKTQDEVNALKDVYPNAVIGMPLALVNTTCGYCTVKVQGNAEIGPDNMKMYHATNGVIPNDDKPDDAGHVFAAGKGFLPEYYTYADKANRPKRMMLYDGTKYTDQNTADWDFVSDTNHANVWEYFKNIDEYITFIQTQALASNTDVTIDGNAFVKGSVYGGSENGIVQYDTRVYIKGGQIGCGKNTTSRHPETVWEPNYTVPDGTDLECASWEYKSPYSPYDPYATYKKTADGKYYYDASYEHYAEGGAVIATDGHTYFGNVFGGGSGCVPYFDTSLERSMYLNSAGQVKGNTNVTISGGHILTNVYGGCEATNVMGLATVKMTGGTLGVPRTEAQITAHPVTCYLFGAGKGDQRVFFDKDTNVKDAEVEVDGGRIYGSVFGGGEDGHVMRHVKVTIKQSSGETTKIGTTGDTYVDGNVFGGGRGFGGDALTAGNVGGCVEVNIEGGTMLGSVYGGGRLASVGYGLYLTTGDEAAKYGKMRADDEYDDPSKPISTTQTAAAFFAVNPFAENTFTSQGRGYITVNVKGGTIGNDKTNAQYGGHVFGGCMGRLTKLDGSANSLWNLLATAKKTTVNISGSPFIKRSVFGGGEMGTVTTDAIVNVKGGTIGTAGKGAAEFGNVYGGGKGYFNPADPEDCTYVLAGIVKGNTQVTIEDDTSGETTVKPTIYHNIYGGGAYGSVGNITLGNATYVPGINSVSNMPTAWERKTGDTGTNTGTATVTVTGGIIGTDGHNNGMVFGSSRGDISAPGTIHDHMAWVYNTHVTIGTSGTDTPLIRGSVYGSGENGHVFQNTQVDVHGGTIGLTTEQATDPADQKGFNYPSRGNVYGSGCGTDKYYSGTIPDGHSAYDGEGDTYNPLAGIVLGNTKVLVDGGHVVHNVYGAGAMGSVGTIDNTKTEEHKSGDKNSETDNTTFYDFGLSWPVKYEYKSDNTIEGDDKVTGKTTVTIEGNAQIGVDDPNSKGGHVFGAARGAVDVGVNDITTHRYEEANYANVRTAEVIIGTGEDTPRIDASVYGGGEDGHVYEDASVTINSGIIARSVFGGGKGESTYEATLWEPLSSAPNDQTQHQEKSSPEPVHSWTAGRVYGNTTVTMKGGQVGYFIYGGGNLGSVGKGNYAGGADDYSKAGYGELPSASGSLWTNTDFTGSGVSTVNLLGGTVGDANGVTVGNNSNVSYDEDGIPYGSVFGGCRGTAAMDVGARSPRYRYVPDFFMGYVNKAVINIGGTSETELATGNGPTVYGSVYGGGQDGHVRNSSAVNIFKGTIAGQNSTIDTSGRSGHVFGAGSGIGTYIEDGVDKCSFSSGSVTGTSTVAVSGGSIAGNIYGGGAMASVGPPKTGQPLDEQKAATNDVKSYSYTKVDIKGGTIGGSIFGASRGPSDAFRKTAFTDKGIDYDPSKFATDIWSDVLISGGTISGSVYGGGETGQVKCGVNVNILGGNIETDVYGGGALANTNTSNLKQERGTNYWLWTDESRTAKYTTTVNLLGGAIGGDAYGGGLGRKAADNVEAVEAKVYGDVKVNLNGLEAADYVASTHGTLTTGESARLEQLSSVGYQIKDAAKGAVVSRVFGCNNLNGSPQGKVRVHVFGTQNGNSGKTKITDKTQSDYDVAAVYGGGNLAAYVPMGPAAPGTNATTIVDDYKHTTQRAEVIIDGCHRTSIKQVYGGGNAASAPATFVEVNGTYEIDEVFGGGNGADEYSLVEGGVTKWYQNPGANVGYENFTTVNKSTEGHDGSTKEKAYPADTKLDASTKGLRQANYAYGSGAATTNIKGGKIHVVYGGSNKKGNISITALSMYESMYDDCPMDVDESYGGGKDAPIDGTIDVRLSCAHGVKEIFGGAKNADVNSDINLTITNGSSLERVFGGNNTSGAIAGSITVNIEEGGCEPIKIKELYAGGYLAPYSIYGYKDDGRGGYVNDTIDYGGTIGTISQRKTLSKSDWETFKAQLQTFITVDSTALAGKTDEQIAADPDLLTKAVELAALRERISSYPKKDPRINVISATRIDTIYGGGYQALVVGSPHVNVNMTNGKVEVKEVGSGENQSWQDADGNQYTTERTTETTGEGTEARTKYYTTLPIGTIGSIFGGGNLADIDGDTYVEIGTGKWLNADDVWETKDTLGVVYKYNDSTRKWDYEIQDLENATTVTYSVNTMPTPARNAATIDDNVFGGGKGAANSFTCEKAMIGVNNEGEGATDPVGGTSVAIANGTVGGSVYGGGMIGRVEKNTMVTIGIDPIEGIRPEKFSPIIRGNVFGAGMGVETHGYSGLVRGNSTVTILGEAKVESSVYGGGEKASVGRYWIATSPKEATQHGVEVGMPYDLKNGGTCTVIVRGNAEIGPDSMKMERYDDEAKPLPPDDTGYVFGGGKGVSPYDTATPGRYYMDNGTYTWESYAEDSKEEDYLKYTNTLGITNKTNVTIGGNAFVKGSVYGGSENGHVRVDTHVTIADNCQIGNGEGVNRRYTDEEWSNGRLVEQSESEHEIAQTYSSSLPECAHWPYGLDTDKDGKKDLFAPYDKFADADGKYEDGTSADEGRPTASDGHTFFGNVFGGGSGYYPYKPGKWHRAEGSVGGNTYVNITGGHILTNVYGGNEMTDVAGNCYVTMTGGSIGVPRTLEQIADHPVTCYLFGAGKGDQRIFFNTSTNVKNAIVQIAGNARIYGSVFGGGEDGHVLENDTVIISDGTTISNIRYPYIGTTGTSYVDGNVFGAGRGFSGEALTAGSVGQNVVVNISDGTMLGSLYGGGRLASVGTDFANINDVAHYGHFEEDTDEKTYGHVKVNISGGTIGNVNASGEGAKYSGNVFGGSMGRLTLLDGSIAKMWPQLAQVKTTEINITGSAVITRNVYGGGELGTVRDSSYITIGGTRNADGTISPQDEDEGIPVIGRDLYGGGYGSNDNSPASQAFIEPDGTTIYRYTPMQWSGLVGQGTHINILGGRVKKSVYGGGEMASVGVIDYRITEDANGDITYNNKKYKYSGIVKHADENNSFALSWPYELSYIPGYKGSTHINITGGRIGLTRVEDENNPFVGDKDNGDVYGGGKGLAGNDMVFCANVGSAEININYKDSTATPNNYMDNVDVDCVAGAVYGGGENGHVIGDTYVTLTNGLIGHSLYGGGSGKGKFVQELNKIGSTEKHNVEIYSITAGKVYGDTHVKMEGGYVVRNIYGGGNMGSVGKGNYSSGTDDYYPAGYGETLKNEGLWTASTGFKPNEPISESNKPTTWADYFLSSGKTKVEIIGGQVGYVNTTDPSKTMKDGLPYGCVFGGSRGESAPNIKESPRYWYSPEFFSGYVNETEVIIGDATKVGEENYTGPKILGSVFGGGQDGHVRRDTHVIVEAGEIGMSLSGKDLEKGENARTNETILGGISTDGKDNPQWLHRGNVYGAGSGIGKYEYDFNANGRFTIEENGNEEDETQIETWNYKNPLKPDTPATPMKEIDYSTSAGSVTRFTQVDIHGGTIHRNVYGGGSLSSIGPLKINQVDEPYKKGDTAEGHGPGLQSQCTVNIGGAGKVTIGTPDDYQEHYGGEVYGASRGDLSIGEDFGVTVWTLVFIKDGATILGNVFGGGDNGMVKQDSEVIIGEAKAETTPGQGQGQEPGQGEGD